MSNIQASGRLDAKFWSRFSRDYWEKKPLVMNQVSSPLFQIDASQVFTLLLRFSDLARKANSSHGLKLYIDGVLQDQEELLDLLPVKKDRSLLGYHERMNQMFEDYCLVCDELIQVNPEKWNVLGDFTESLYRQVGMPNRFAEMGLYLGNYRTTPFGVHVDGCGVFSFPVIGTKKFRLWTSEYLKKNPELDRAQSYQKHLKASQVLFVGPGDMSYWPSSSWHVAESDGGFTATWSLGIWVDQTLAELVGSALMPTIRTRLGKKQKSVMLETRREPIALGEIFKLPRTFEEAIGSLGGLTKTEIRDVFLKLWIEKISSRGFKNTPRADLKLNIKKGDKVRVRKDAPVFWGVLSSDQVILSAQGTTVELKKTKELLSLIEKLNSGKELCVDEFLRKPLLMQLMKKLYQGHVLQKT